MSFDSLLPYTVTVTRTTGTSISASGEVTRTYAATGTSVRADIQPARVALRRIDLGEQVYGEYTGFFPVGTAIGELDKVTDAAGIEYLVLFVSNIRGHHLEVSLHRGIF
jgi:hypothetical protein